MKVFVSSVISGYEDYREAACRAVESLGAQVVRAEDFPASEETPQVACLRGVRSADVTVLLLAGRYGYPQQSGLSATHEEFNEAAERGPVLVFEHVGIDREPQQQEFINEVQQWAGGVLTAEYSTPEQVEPDFGRRWRYAMRNGDQVVEARDLGDHSDAMEWASSRLRDHGLREAEVVLVRNDGTEKPIGTVRRAEEKH